MFIEKEVRTPIKSLNETKSTMMNSSTVLRVHFEYLQLSPLSTLSSLISLATTLAPVANPKDCPLETFVGNFCRYKSATQTTHRIRAGTRRLRDISSEWSTTSIVVTAPWFRLPKQSLFSEQDQVFINLEWPVHFKCDVQQALIGRSWAKDPTQKRPLQEHEIY